MIPVVAQRRKGVSVALASIWVRCGVHTAPDGFFDPQNRLTNLNVASDPIPFLPSGHAVQPNIAAPARDLKWMAQVAGDSCVACHVEDRNGGIVRVCHALVSERDNASGMALICRGQGCDPSEKTGRRQQRLPGAKVISGRSACRSVISRVVSSKSAQIPANRGDHAADHKVAAHDPCRIGRRKFGIGMGNGPVPIPRHGLTRHQINKSQGLSTMAFDGVSPQGCDGDQLFPFRGFGVVGGFVLAAKARFDVAKDVRLCAVAAHNQILLRERDRVVGDPVENQAAGKRAKHEHEDPRHPCQDHFLRGFSWREVQFLLHPHRDTQDDWQNAKAKDRKDTADLWYAPWQ